MVYGPMMHTLCGPAESQEPQKRNYGPSVTLAIERVRDGSPLGISLLSTKR